MQPPNGETKKQYVVQHLERDLTVKSGGHLARNIVSGAMLVIGLGVVLVKYIVALVNQLPTNWGQNELILVLVLVGGGISILFTQTAVAVLHIVWPFGGRKQ